MQAVCRLAAGACLSGLCAAVKWIWLNKAGKLSF